MTTLAYTYDELDEILRGDGGAGHIGMSAIDGQIAALVAAPSFAAPAEWLPFIFKGKMPRVVAGANEHRAVQTIFNRYNEVTATLEQCPGAYRPIFMKSDDGEVIVHEWVIGFMLGVGLRVQQWGGAILLTEHRKTTMAPILAYYDVGQDFLLDLPIAEKKRLKSVGYHQIPQAVAAVHAICAPFRAAERRAQAATQTPPRRRRRR